MFLVSIHTLPSLHYKWMSIYIRYPFISSTYVVYDDDDGDDDDLYKLLYCEESLIGLFSLNPQFYILNLCWSGSTTS